MTLALQDTLQRFYRAPYPAILALVVVFIYQGIGHTLMIEMERLLGGHLYNGAMVGGLAGAALTWMGRNRSDNAATLLGFAGGNLIWLCWIEFSFVYYAHSMGVSAITEHGAVVTKPEYVVMQSSVGVLMASLVYFFFRDTRCNAFMWLQKAMRMKMTEQVQTKNRNTAAIVAIETIFVTWFCYVLLLLTYDKSLTGGDRSPTAYLVLFGSLVWGVYLFTHLVRFKRVAPAIRYAIPTAIIFWNAVEILGRWDLFTEIWVHPERYAVEMAVVGGGFALAFLLAALSPGRAHTA